MRHLLLLPAAFGTACFLQGSPGSQPDSGPPNPVTDAGQPFTADPPSVYVAKVKNLLTGLPPLPSEVHAVEIASDPQAALVGLIDQWMALPQYNEKMLAFFQRAFQQTQIASVDFENIIPNEGSLVIGSFTNNLLQNITESFARTMLAFVASGRPLTDAMTTNQLMMTPPLMELYAFLDANQATDTEGVMDAFAKANPTVSITLEDTNSAITPAESMTVGGPYYMQWYYPNLSTITSVTACQLHTRTYHASARVLHDLMYGGVNTVVLGTAPNTTTCGATGGLMASAQFNLADFSDWKLVTIRPPQSGEATTAFYDAAALRTATELVIHTPRVGFFSTPAFQANWPTNASNEMRVTINQSLIVALGAQVDGSDVTDPGQNPPGLDQMHVSAGAACVGCHKTLDPTRAILQATYSYGYGQQNMSSLQSVTGWFAFQGVVNKNIQTIGDFGTQLANHPLLPAAWAQKLCFYANSRGCAADDPEFQRITKDFQTSGFQWKRLVEDVFSSPITTNASLTQTASENGEVVSIARRDHLCTLLDARLGLNDSCGIRTLTGLSSPAIAQIAAGMPSDGYGRGAPIPVLPAQPTLFYRAALENICEDVAAIVVDNKSPPAGAKTYSSTTGANASAAIADFVSNLMGIAQGDDRYPVMVQMLTQHFYDAMGKALPSDALKSTFVTACLSPMVAGIGM